MPKYQNWLFTHKDHIATLTLNRPDHSNSLTPETFKELQDITDFISENKDIWVVIVEAMGKHFSTGMDVAVIGSAIKIPEAQFRESLLGMQRNLDAFEALRKPTIAKLHGFCLGGGLILALCCDFRIASQKTILGFPEVKRGVPVVMGTQRVTRVAGVAATKELILLAKNVNAHAAKECGLVHEVVPPDELDDAVTSLAHKFLSMPIKTVGAAKYIIDVGYQMSLRDSQDMEVDLQVELLHSPDFKEAIESFFEDRPPSFMGE
jgi:enoyl-CoA hydratase/carnithine racemase